jgi:sialidase-1
MALLNCLLGAAPALALSVVLRANAAPILTHTDVFVSGQGGYRTYRIPAVEVAPDGTLLAFAEARKYSDADPGFGRQDIDLVYRRSTNNGATWSPMTVLEDPGELWSAANPATVVDRTNGRCWVFYLRSRPGRSTDTSRPGTDDMQTLARWSDNSGQTWSEPVDLTAVAREMEDKTWRASVPGPGGAIQTRNGRLLVPMWKAPFANFAIFSDDHGRTWQHGQLVPGKQGGDECQVVELADGRILMDIRQETGAHRWLAESGDGGKTWAEPRPGLVVTPVMCALERFTLQAAGDDRNRLVWTGPKGPDRRRLVIRTSYDEGRTFASERLVSDQYAAYSDLAILKDKTVGLLWERGVERGYQFITFTRLNREWLEPGTAPAVISRGAAAGTYQAFPDVCRLTNGDLLCVFYAGYGHVSSPRADWPRGGRICTVRSQDDGRSWSAPRVLFDGPFDDRDPHVAQMSDGLVVCTFFTYRPQPDGKALCDTCLVASRDGGATWETEPRVVAAGWPSSAPVRELPDGTRLLGVYREEGQTAYGGVIRSTDHGLTWSQPIPIGQNSGVRLDAETDFVQLKDGTLYAALRGDRVNMHFATNPDGGLTWSAVKDIGFPGHCPHFTRLRTGEILLTHRLPLTALHVSRDEGKTWQGPYQIDATPGAYPSTVELKDGTVLVVYYEEGPTSAIRARRFKLTPDGVEFLSLEAR